MHSQIIYRYAFGRNVIDTLDKACTRTGWRVHAFVLMGNHYPLHLETPAANLVVADCLSRYPKQIDEAADQSVAKKRERLRKITILRD